MRRETFPARYRDGVFIAFHGSWNRAPYPQGGYNVVFQPLDGAPGRGQLRSLRGRFRRRGKNSRGRGAPALGRRSRARRIAIRVGRHSRTIYRIVYHGRSQATRRERLAQRLGSGRRYCRAPGQPARGDECRRRIGSAASPFPLERRGKWWLWGIVFTMGQWAKRLVRVAMARTYGFTARSQSDQRQMVMERRQFCGNPESDHQWRSTTEAISQPDAAHRGHNSPPNSHPQWPPTSGPSAIGHLQRAVMGIESKLPKFNPDDFRL